jgi:hypothetical protein
LPQENGLVIRSDSRKSIQRAGAFRLRLCSAPARLKQET